MKVFVKQVMSFAVFLLGLNLLISNNGIRFGLNGWSQFGMSALAAMLIGMGMIIYLKGER